MYYKAGRYPATQILILKILNFKIRNISYSFKRDRSTTRSNCKHVQGGVGLNYEDCDFQMRS